MPWFALAMVSATLSAVAAIAQKKVLFSFSPLEFSFVVSLIIGALSSVAALWVDFSTVTAAAFAIILVKSIISGIAFLLVMMALAKNPISTALPLLGITPAVTAILAFPILGEGLNTWQVAGVVLMIIGTYVLEYRPGHGVLETLRSGWTSRMHYPIFGAVLLFGLSSVFDRKLVGGLHIEPAVVLVYQHLVYFMMFGVALVMRNVSLRTVCVKSLRLLPLLGAIALCTIAYRWFQLEATTMAPVALVLAVKRTSILFASLFGGSLFSEERLKTKLLGAAIIVVSGFLILRNVG